MEGDCAFQKQFECKWMFLTAPNTDTVAMTTA